MSKRISCFALVAILVGAGTALATDPFCVQLEDELDGRPFVAKVPPYDTEVGYDRIYHLERDAEGETIAMVDVDCGGKALEMTLEPDRKGETVKFFLGRDQRRQGAPRPHDRARLRGA